MSTPGPTIVFCPACGAHNQPDARFCQSCGQTMTPVSPVPVTGSIAAYASHPYGGFWIRVLAWLIDIVLVYCVVLPLAFLARIGFHLFGSLLYVAGTWLYFSLLTSSEWQATVGKRVCDLRVTDLEARRLSFGRATLRYFSKILSGLILGIGYLMVAFTERKQGLHDLIAGTLVMKGRTP